MQHIYLTQGLSELFYDQIGDEPYSRSDAQFWYAHLVPTISGPFVLLMEEHTRYCLTFHNPSETALYSFPLTFERQLRQHVIAITQANGKLAKRIALTVSALCDTVDMSVGMDYSVSADLFELGCTLQNAVEDCGGFPVPGLSELSLALHLNRQPRQNADGRSLIPLHAFHRRWLEQLGFSQPAPVF